MRDGGMRTGIHIEVTAEDTKRLEAIVAARGSAQKHVWRSRIILATAQGLGTQTIMAATGKSKPCVWRWQERFMAEGVDGLLRDKAIHVILDNYATHKQPKVRAWLDRHPRWTFHFVPTSCSWLNAVEGFFAKLTRRRLKNGVFHSIVDLQAAINRFISEHNGDPKPFVWKADPDEITAAVRRGHQTLESIH